MSKLLRVSPLLALLLLGACTTIPTGPSVMALPGTGKVSSVPPTMPIAGNSRLASRRATATSRPSKAA
jgi:hypothetical protein